MLRDRHYTVDGLLLGIQFPEQKVREVLAYKPRQDDVFIVTYPKCGTTWMQHIVYYVFSNGTPPQSHEEFESKTPFFEFKGQEAADNLPRPAAIKTHLPFNRQPYSKDAKYIYITRNPFDCCVSFFHHVRNIPTYEFGDGTFEEFFEEFLRGHVEFGDYFDHLLSWYPHRNDPNVLFLTYEDLKKDIRSSILKVADVLGDHYGEILRRDSSVLERIVELTSFENMKNVVNARMRERMENMLRKSGDGRHKRRGNFVREGKVGGWKSYFTPMQVKRMKEWIHERTAGTDVMELWKDLTFDI